MLLSFTRNIVRNSKFRPMSTSASALVVNANSNILVVELNRPKALNALSKDMCDDLIDVLKNRINVSNTSVAAFVVKGNGGKAFCAGGDVKSIWGDLVAANEDRGTGKPGYLHTDFFRNEYTMNYMLGTSRVPQVSLWDGVVMGGGVGISVLGQFRVATEKTLFAMPETAIGLFPDVGSSAWLPHLSDGYGAAIGLTGCRLGAADLVHSKIATHFVKSDLLPELEAKLASDLSASASPEQNKDAINKILTQFQAASGAPDDSKSVILKNQDTIRRCFGDHNTSLDQILSALTNESKGGNQWATKTLETLSKMSPSSLKLTLAQLQRGKPLDLAGCLKMEYRMIMRCMKYADFQEGVRALLVDKDNTPKWNPAGLEAVSQALIDSYFESLGEHELVL